MYEVQYQFGSTSVHGAAVEGGGQARTLGKSSRTFPSGGISENESWVGTGNSLALNGGQIKDPVAS